MSAIDDLLANSRNAPRAVSLPAPPAKRVAVLACMDARLDVYRVLGLQPGDAHIIRNAGGVATDDALRSIAISQRMLGTAEVMLIHHTDCGMLTIDEDQVVREMEEEAGEPPPFALHAFSDLEEDVRESVRAIRTSPFLPNTDVVRGFIFEVESGRLREVDVPC